MGFLTSAIRNILRLIDFLPSAYLLGAIVILATRKNQRIGDVVAGTLVVRERPGSVRDLPRVPPDGAGGAALRDVGHEPDHGGRARYGSPIPRTA